MSATSYPLQWPVRWPRTPAHKRQDSKHRFKRAGGQYGGRSAFWTFAEARDALMTELERIGARHLVLSTNYELRLDGLPRANGAQPDDRGIAVYFELKGRPTVMACDMHVRAEENMRSITLALEAMRQLERHGGGTMMERAFEGFAAIEAPGRKHWSAVLGVAPHADRGEIEAAFRFLARQRHPDAGGSDAAMSELNAARDAALKEVC